MTSYFKDINTKKNIGKVVIPLIAKKNNMELVDCDITLLSNNSVKIYFEEQLKQSSESNEYYLVYELEYKKRFDIETVNRYCISDKLEDTSRTVYLSAFPFQLDLFENEDEMNRYLGLGKEIDIKGIGKKVVTVDYKMMADGRALTGQEEPCSFILGRVINFEDVKVNIAENIIEFKIIYLETAIGNIPVAVNEKNFDLRKLKKNVLIGMMADIKADLME